MTHPLTTSQVHLQLLHIWPGSAENSLPREAGGVCCSRASQQIPEALPGWFSSKDLKVLGSQTCLFRVMIFAGPKACLPAPGTRQFSASRQPRLCAPESPSQAFGSLLHPPRNLQGLGSDSVGQNPIIITRHPPGSTRDSQLRPRQVQPNLRPESWAGSVSCICRLLLGLLGCHSCPSDSQAC